MADYVLTDQFVSEWNRIRKKVDNLQIRGIGGSNGRDGIVIGPPKVAFDSEDTRKPEWIIITGSATKYATYAGNVFVPKLSASFNAGSGGTVAQSDVGAAGSDSIYGVNVREIGQSTNDLSSSSFLPLIFRAMPIGLATDGKRVFLFDGLQWENCS